ncbi:MAG: hypothetical protein GWN86_14945, partial [Desulfobacterales bacterium]|nr:hypothetical protein [Desulfobacterales bacterium]
MAEEEKKGRRPDISLVQPGVDQDGKKQLRSVGGMWETKTKEGKKMWTV